MALAIEMCFMCFSFKFLSLRRRRRRRRHSVNFKFIQPQFGEQLLPTDDDDDDDFTSS